MESLPGAASLVRGLLVLARAGHSGVLAVRTDEMSASVAVSAGRIVAMKVEPDDGDSLGDELRRLEAWDEDAAARGDGARPGEPFGRWACRVGATDEGALSHALRRQLQRRIVRLLALDPPEMRLRPGGAVLPDAPALKEPPTTSELIVAGLRESLAAEPRLLVRRRLGCGMLVLSPLGRELLEHATLWPDEEAMIGPLRRGASVDTLAAAAGGSPRAERLLYALRLVGACESPAPRDGYALLLRKSRQLRRAARAPELLDLPGHAQAAEARRALRRLATVVHPDRFGERAPAGVREASTNVMRALLRAQGEIR